MAILVLDCFYAFAQSKITGQILDSKRVPVSLATISIVGENATATSDDLGIFILTIPYKIKRGDVITIRITKVGYKALTRQIAVSYLSTSFTLLKETRKSHSSVVAKKPSDKVNNQNDVQQNEVRVPELSGIFNNSPMQFGNGNIQNNLFNGRIDRHLDMQTLNDVLKYLVQKNKEITIEYQSPDPESRNFSSELEKQLKARGYSKVVLFGHIDIGTPQQQSPILLDTANYIISIELNGH